jgi:hypothetical protein
MPKCGAELAISRIGFCQASFGSVRIVAWDGGNALSSKAGNAAKTHETATRILIRICNLPRLWLRVAGYGFRMTTPIDCSCQKARPVGIVYVMVAFPFV